MKQFCSGTPAARRRSLPTRKIYFEVTLKPLDSELPLPLSPGPTAAECIPHRRTIARAPLPRGEGRVRAAFFAIGNGGATAARDQRPATTQYEIIPS